MHLILCNGQVFEVDDFKSMRSYGDGCVENKLVEQDKGHENEWRQFVASLRNGSRFLIPWNELAETWSITSQANKLCVEGQLK